VNSSTLWKQKYRDVTARLSVGGLLGYGQTGLLVEG